MPTTVRVKIRRQDRPDAPSRHESFEVPYERGMNVTTLLQRIAASPVTADGRPTTPVAYDACCLEEVCGSCTMLINGQVRQACSALVDDLLADRPQGITLEPMSKFPTIRDLFVDRSRMFRALQRMHAWVEVDDYGDRRTSAPIPPEQQEEAYPFSRCMTCGCCVEVCPQFNDKSDFVGPQAVGQAMLFNSHPVGRMTATRRLTVLMEPGGIADCGNAQNCVKVCPKNIPLLDALARAGRATTAHAVKSWLGK